MPIAYDVWTPDTCTVSGNTVTALVRLFERAADGREQATAWAETRVDAVLTLGSIHTTDDAPRAVVLIGARMPLTLHGIQEEAEEVPAVID